MTKKIADELIEIHEAKFGKWSGGKVKPSFGGNVLQQKFSLKGSKAEVIFIKDNVLEPSKHGKMQALLIVPATDDKKKINKEIDFSFSKSDKFFGDGEIKSALAKADKELSK